MLGLNHSISAREPEHVYQSPRAQQQLAASPFVAAMENPTAPASVGPNYKHMDAAPSHPSATPPSAAAMPGEAAGHAAPLHSYLSEHGPFPPAAATASPCYSRHGTVTTGATASMFCHEHTAMLSSCISTIASSIISAGDDSSCFGGSAYPSQASFSTGTAVGAPCPANPGPPHGAKAVCGKRAKMEDTFTVKLALLEVQGGPCVEEEDTLPPRIAATIREATGMVAAAAAAAAAANRVGCPSAMEVTGTAGMGGCPSGMEVVGTPPSHQQRHQPSPLGTPTGIVGAHSGSDHSSIDSVDVGGGGADTLHFFAVYDGHGGFEASEHCSARLHMHLTEAMAQHPHLMRAAAGCAEGSGLGPSAEVPVAPPPQPPPFPPLTVLQGPAAVLEGHQDDMLLPPPATSRGAHEGACLHAEHAPAVPFATLLPQQCCCLGNAGGSGAFHPLSAGSPPQTGSSDGAEPMQTCSQAEEVQGRAQAAAAAAAAASGVELMQTCSGSSRVADVEMLDEEAGELMSPPCGAEEEQRGGETVDVPATTDVPGELLLLPTQAPPAEWCMPPDLVVEDSSHGGSSTGSETCVPVAALGSAVCLSTAVVEEALRQAFMRTDEEFAADSAAAMVSSTYVPPVRQYIPSFTRFRFLIPSTCIPRPLYPPMWAWFPPYDFCPRVSRSCFSRPCVPPGWQHRSGGASRASALVGGQLRRLEGGPVPGRAGSTTH